MKFTFNINDKVSCKLTADGVKIVHASGYYPITQSDISADGEVHTQAWCLMATFGAAIHMGGPSLIVENEITLRSDAV